MIQLHVRGKNQRRYRDYLLNPDYTLDSAQKLINHALAVGGPVVFALANGERLTVPVRECKGVMVNVPELKVVA